MIELLSDGIHFNIKNSKPATINAPIENTGIGINNTRKRLDLLYDSDYSLNIYDREHEFEVDLIVPVRNT